MITSSDSIKHSGRRPLDPIIVVGAGQEFADMASLIAAIPDKLPINWRVLDLGNDRIVKLTWEDSAWVQTVVAEITAAEKTKLSNLSGTNTGDQDISGIAVNAGNIAALAAVKVSSDEVGNVKALTQAEYDALGSYDPRYLYVITDAGDDSFMLAWKGDWAAGTYKRNDGVHHEGNAYIATVQTTETPSLTASDWDLLASKGDTGTGISIAGSVANAAALDPSYTGNEGDMFITQDDGHGHVWNGSSWDDVGQIKGDDGVDGTNGTDGQDGDSAYVYVRYADDTGGNGMSTSPTGKDYIGVKSSTTPLTPLSSDFTGLWTKFIGTDGQDGADGTNGTDGADGSDGDNAYVYVRYADDVAGTNFNTSPVGRTYIGVVSSSTPLTPDVADFVGTWRKFVGEDGEDMTLSTNYINLSGTDVVNHTIGDQFEKTCGVDQQFNIVSGKINFPFRMKLTGGNLLAELFVGYNHNWIAGSDLSDYIAGSDNYLYCEIRDTNEMFLFFEK